MPVSSNASIHLRAGSLLRDQVDNILLVYIHSIALTFAIPYISQPASLISYGADSAQIGSTHLKKEVPDRGTVQCTCTSVHGHDVIIITD